MTCRAPSVFGWSQWWYSCTKCRFAIQAAFRAVSGGPPVHWWSTAEGQYHPHILQTRSPEAEQAVKCPNKVTTKPHWEPSLESFKSQRLVGNKLLFHMQHKWLCKHSTASLASKEAPKRTWPFHSLEFLSLNWNCFAIWLTKVFSCHCAIKLLPGWERNDMIVYWSGLFLSPWRIYCLIFLKFISF